MGVRGEIFSTRVLLQNRTYFFNVKENRMGDLYLNIVESKNKEAGGFDRQSVILFADDLQEFLKGFDESLRVLEKSVREKRKSGAAPGRRDSENEDRERRDDRGERRGEFQKSGPKREWRGERPPRKNSRDENAGQRERAERPGKPYAMKGGRDRPGRDKSGGEGKKGRPSSGKRVVIRRQKDVPR
jgi:hypothetical protein